MSREQAEALIQELSRNLSRGRNLRRGEQRAIFAEKELEPVDALKACREACKGPANCTKNGYIFDIQKNCCYICPDYRSYKAMFRLQKKISEHIPPNLEKASFESYVPTNKSQKALLGTAERYFQKEAYLDGKGIIVTGPNGVGKTHIVVAMYKELVLRNIPVVFARPKSTGSFKEIEEYYRTLEKPEVLIYDDLGTELRKDFIIDLLFKMLDVRNDHRKGLIATTNTPKIELQKWLGPRIYSRLMMKNYILEVTGDDYRASNRELF